MEPGLVRAVERIEKENNLKLRKIVLVDKNFYNHKKRVSDSTGTFEEIIIDFDDKSDIQKKLRDIHKDVLIATCRMEFSIGYFQKIVPFLPYTLTPSSQSLNWSTEKSKMRQRFKDYCPELIPKFINVTSDNVKKSLEYVRDDFSFPVIIKPNGLAASLLVTRCDDMKHLKKKIVEVFSVLDDVYENESGRGDKTLLIEEFIDGDMYSVDAYVNSHGEVFCLPAVRARTAASVGLNGYYCYDVSLPSGLSKEEENRAFEVTQKAIHALQISNSTIHIELFNTKSGWKIIELGPRIGGYREEMYREAYDIDHYYNDLMIRMDKKPDIKTKPLKHVLNYCSYPDEEGRVKAIYGIDEVRKLDSTVYIRPKLKVGDKAFFAENGGWFVCEGIMSNSSKERLWDDYEKMRQLIKIEVEPF